MLRQNTSARIRPTGYAKALTRALLVASALSGAVALAGDDGIPPDTTAQDLADARQALATLGAAVDGSSRRCAGCHDLSMMQLRDWRDKTLMAGWFCLEPYDDGQTPLPTPRERVDCLRQDRSDPRSAFSPAQLGIYTAGAHTPLFSDLFRAAYPETGQTWEAPYKQFLQQVQMPFGGHNLMTNEDFAQVLDWTKRGMPQMERVLGNLGDPPRTCTAGLAPELADHVAAMQQGGWEARNRDLGMAMFACPTTTPWDVNDKHACFRGQDAKGHDLFPAASALPFASRWNQDMTGAQVRLLRELPRHTSYWMRSSADGRYIGNGVYGSNRGPGEPPRRGSSRGEPDPRGTGGHSFGSEPPETDFGAQISDLAPQLKDPSARRDIKVAALFDPGFFPDGSGFVFHGTAQGAGFCRTSLIDRLTTTQVTFSEPECMDSKQVGLYESIGASVDSGDYLAIDGDFAGEIGSGDEPYDQTPAWLESSYLNFTPMINNGRTYEELPASKLWTPYLGDWALAPSNRLVASRIAGVDAANQKIQLGYRLQLVDRTQTETGYTYALRDVGTVCAQGQKGVFSFDERFFTFFHHATAGEWQDFGFTRADDPEWLQLIGTSNIYVTDLLHGTTRRVTRMQPQQYAQFPHYRSDGWLYFQVLDTAADKRYAVATDASLLLAR